MDLYSGIISNSMFISILVLSLVYEKRSLRFQCSKIDLIPILESLGFILSGSTCFQNANEVNIVGVRIPRFYYGKENGFFI